MMRASKPLPPYGTLIQSADPEVYIAVGADAWDFAERNAPCLVKPAGRRPAEFRWPVAGKEVAIWDLDDDGEALRELAIAVLACGAEHVCARLPSVIGIAGRDPLIEFVVEPRGAS